MNPVPSLLPTPVFTPTGNLHDRLEANYNRLEEQRYYPSDGDLESGGIFQKLGYGWPGDMEGRATLAWVLLGRATGRTPKFLDTALVMFPEKMNALGYFGSIIPEGVCDEQVLASHGWVLRALCEDISLTNREESREMAERIITNLVLPTQGHHKTYPIRPEDRDRETGSFIGGECQQLGAWKLSSDIGCNFIFMDGVIHAAIVLKDDRLYPIIEELISRFLEVDLIQIKAQTHATLTGIRGLLRWYRHTHEPHLLAAAQERYELYKALGISESYANWNWFGRPTHTEPCAIVDSLLVALQLHQLTENKQFLQDAHYIFYTGLGHSQRFNGGFGCDSVLGSNEDGSSTEISIKAEEAWWCCTMRGAEGLAAVSDASFQFNGETLALPFLTSGHIRYENGPLNFHASIESHYPNQGFLTITLLRCSSNIWNLDFFEPSWARDIETRLNETPVQVERVREGFIRLSGIFSPQTRITYSFKQDLKVTPPINSQTDPNLKALFLGPVQFGHACESPQCKDGVQFFTKDQIPLLPVTDMLHRRSLAGYRRKLLWDRSPL